jgi:hypothetical protein
MRRDGIVHFGSLNGDDERDIVIAACADGVPESPRKNPRRCRIEAGVLSGDLAAAIGRLKAKPGGGLQVHGSGTLIRWLLENDLVAG